MNIKYFDFSYTVIKNLSDKVNVDEQSRGDYFNYDICIIPIYDTGVKPRETKLR